MSNHNIKRGQPKRGLAMHPAVVAAREGYTEALAGKPLNPDQYPDRIGQMNYEIGRLWALNLRAAAIDAPAWPRGRNLPARVQAMLELSFATVGGCQPGQGDGRAGA